MVFKAEDIAELYPEYYIIKVNQFDGLAKNTLDEWIHFLKNEVVDDHTKAKGLLEAKEKMDILKLSKEEMMAYESDLDAWRDYASSMNTHFMDGLAKGEEKGEARGIAMGEANKEAYAAEKMKKVAKNCLQSGMDIPTIIQITGLTENEIHAIA
jgi:predicted transposase/invertase (TIGR01784 family)